MSENETDANEGQPEEEVTEILIGSPPQRLRPLRPGETPAELAVAIGLTRCPECNQFKGTCATEHSEVKLLCICEGINCKRCGRRNIPKPISNLFSERDGHILHVPYFTGFVPCSECREETKPHGAACTSCGSTETVPIVYGLPGAGLAERAKRGEVRLGGCVIRGDDPNWFCRHCGGEFYSREV